MKLKTKEGERLKRLARAYARAEIDLSWLGSCPDDDEKELKAQVKKTWDKLVEAIEELTNQDTTPRDINDR